MSSFTKAQIDEMNEKRRVEGLAFAAMTPEERTRHMQSKAAGKKSPIVMDEFKRLGLVTAETSIHACDAYPPKEKPLRKARTMNKTEGRFADILEARKKRGEIHDWKYELITIKLADGCKYTPDFAVFESVDGGPTLFVETKGSHVWDDAKVKFKVAREQNKWAAFEMWEYAKGGWRQIL